MADAWRHYYLARSVTGCYSLASYPGAPVRGIERGYEATYSWGLCVIKIAVKLLMY